MKAKKAQIAKNIMSGVRLSLAHQDSSNFKANLTKKADQILGNQEKRISIKRPSMNFESKGGNADVNELQIENERL